MGKQQGATCVQALVDALKGINGGPQYNTNLGGRVYTKSWTPMDAKVPADKPFVTVTMVMDEGHYEWSQDDRWLLRGLKFGVALFVPETSSEMTTSQASLDMLRLEDDVLQVLLADPTLNGNCSRCEVVPGGGPLSGVPELKWASKLLLVKAYQYLTVTDLTP